MSSSARTVLLTGATDGIGLALARLYQARGDTLILTGRRAPDSLDPALFTPASYCRVDLALPYCADIVAQFVQARHISHIDLLIHNAGIGYFGATAAQSPQSIRDLVAINLRAPVALTHRLLPWLQRAPRGQSRLVFISSVVSVLPCPDYAVYGASKAALDGFARSLRVELRPHTAVQVIHPGATRTGMHERSGAKLDRRRWERFPPPEHVVASIAHAIDREQDEVTIGTGNRLLQLGGRHIPGALDWLLRTLARWKG
jgi:short-subunit dehydrogenase